MKQLIVLLFALLGLTINAYADILVSAANGAFVTKPDLATAATAADSSGKTVVVNSPLTAVQSNISSATLHAWPKDRKLKVENGGSINNTTTFIVNGPFDAGLYQVFTGSGTVLFGSGSINLDYSEWWGSKGDGSTNDTRSIQNAINACNVVKFQAKIYKHTGLTLKTNSVLLGDTDYNNIHKMYDATGKAATLQLIAPATNPGITVPVGVVNVRIEKLALIGDSSGGASSSSHGVTFVDDGAGTIDKSALVDMSVQGFKGNGIYWGVGRHGLELYNVTSVQNGNCGIFAVGPDTVIDKCDFGLNTSYGIYLGGVNNIMTGNNIYSNDIGIVFDASAFYNSIIGGSVDRNNHGGISVAGKYNVINGIAVTSNSVSAGNTYSGITMQKGADQNIITGVMFGYAGGANKQSYNLLINNGAYNTKYFGNAVDPNSFASAEYINNGDLSNVIQSQKQAPSYSYSMPTTGLFGAGKIVYNLRATPQGKSPNKYLILGWMRLTTGSRHVLNTDWVEMRVLTGQ